MSSGRRGDSDLALQEGGNGTLPPHAHVCMVCRFVLPCLRGRWSQKVPKGEKGKVLFEMIFGAIFFVSPLSTLAAVHQTLSVLVLLHLFINPYW